MEHLPLFARLTDRRCLVVGGGVVGTRKVRQLRSAGALVTVEAPSLTDELQRLADQGEIEFDPPGDSGNHARAIDAERLSRYWLIVAATDDKFVNARIASAADAAKRFCNVVDDPDLSSFIMPAIVDRAPITVAISSGGHSPVLARWVKGLIESWLPVRLGELAKLAGRWRARVSKTISNLDQRRRFWEQVIEGPVPEHVYAGRDVDAEVALDRLLAEWRSTRARPTGEAYLVGAGPGSADLITLRGRQLLAQAEVVLYDRLVGEEVLEFARRDAELISVAKTPGQPSIKQAQINRLLVEHVRAGKRVCRLKGGDPMIFGRGGEELEALAEAGLPFQVVPGVSAVEGCASYAGIPLTLRGAAQSVVLTTGHTERGIAEVSSFEPGQTLALYMGVARYAVLAERLMARGYDPETPVAVVERGTTKHQRVIGTVLGSLARAAEAHEVSAPALLLVGETTRFAERYSWYAPERLVLYPDPESLERAS